MTEGNKKNPFKRIKAQTATELAIFGAILIFVLGIMIRYAVNFNYIQNQSLEAMRLAFTQSFLSSESGDTTSKINASLLFIEDRKDTDITGSGGGTASGRYGALNRNPYVVGGSGSFTRHMLMGTDYGYEDELPTMDVFVNGRHFTFTTAGYKTYHFGPDCDPVTGTVPACSGVVRQESCCPHADYTDVPCVASDPNLCPYFYTRITRIDDNFSPLCDNAGFKPFDLDRDGDSDVPAGGTGDCRNFAWQWKQQPASVDAIKIDEGGSASYDVDGDLKEEQVLKVTGSNNRARSIDISHVIARSQAGIDFAQFCAEQNSAVITAQVIDYQEGDLDFSYDTYDKAASLDPVRYATPASSDAVHPGRPRNIPSPGLMNDVRMYTTTGTGGTYFTIEEGKLYGPSGQFIRTVQKHDQIDFIERKMQLSNDTGRMCDSRYGMYSPVNGPIQACCSNGGVGGDCCNVAGNRIVTCFNRDNLILYIRSSISDRAGRKWITDVSSDQMPIQTPSP